MRVFLSNKISAIFPPEWALHRVKFSCVSLDSSAAASSRISRISLSLQVLPPPSTMTEAAENNDNVQKASSRRKDKTSTGQGKLRKRNELSSPSMKRTKKPEGTTAEELWFQQLQIEAFGFTWSKIESTIKDVLRNINASVFNSIQQWVLECFNATRSSREPSFDEVTRSFPVLNYTTGHLFTGLVITRQMEFVDDKLTFEELGLSLKSHGCHVAMLSMLEFSVKNGIAGCLKALLREFLASPIDSADISILASWYREQGNCNKPLVLIINNLERCCGSVLSDFILILSEWVVKVPIILIIGVATTVDAPRKILPSHVLQHMCPHRFILGSSAERMDAIVEAILVKHFAGFSIGHKVALFLRNYFINLDGTLTSFIRALKIACILHFSSEPLSLILGRIFAAEDQKDGKSALSPDTVLEYVSELPSYARNQLVDRTGKNLALDLYELVTAQKLWSTAVLCLYEAGKYSRVQLLDLFCEVLNPDLYQSRAFDSHLGAEKDQGPSSLKDPCETFSISQRGDFICQIIRKVRDLPAATLCQLIKSWEKLTADVSEIYDKLGVLQSLLRCDHKKSPSKSSKDKSKRCASRIPQNIEKDSKAINSQAITFIHFLVRNYVKPIECMPFHEIFCFTNVEKLQLALIGDPRRRIQVDLVESHKILRCSCCKKSGNALLPSMHDTSIMFSLAQEHGDLINLHDWFQSFKTIVLNQRTKRKHKSKQSPLPKKRKDANGSGDQSESSIQARFCRAVTELQITGLVRMPSKRRPDCVQRVAFGF